MSNKKAEYFSKLLIEYVNQECGGATRQTVDTSPLEQWMGIKLFELQSTNEELKGELNGKNKECERWQHLYSESQNEVERLKGLTDVKEFEKMKQSRDSWEEMHQTAMSEWRLCVTKIESLKAQLNKGEEMIEGLEKISAINEESGLTYLALQHQINNIISNYKAKK